MHLCGPSALESESQSVVHLLFHTQYIAQVFILKYPSKKNLLSQMVGKQHESEKNLMTEIWTRIYNLDLAHSALGIPLHLPQHSLNLTSCTIVVHPTKNMHRVSHLGKENMRSWCTT